MLIAAWPAHAALAVVQTVSCQQTGAGTSCTTSGVTTTTGNLFVASSGYCCAAFVSVTDNKSNTYANAVPEVSQDSGLGRQDYKENGAGGASHTFTFTGDSGGLFLTFSVTEISGAATSSALDQVKSATTSVSGTSHTTGNTSTTTQANEILVGFGSSIFATTFTTDTGAGWTEQTNQQTDASHEGLVTGTRIVAATGTYAYTYTTGSSVTAVQGIATYKEASAATRQRCIGCGIDKKVIGG